MRKRTPQEDMTAGLLCKLPVIDSEATQRAVVTRISDDGLGMYFAGITDDRKKEWPIVPGQRFGVGPCVQDL